MKIKLFHKLLIALFACTALVLVSITWVARVNIRSGFVNFLQQQDISRVEQLLPELADLYSENGNWDELARNPREFYYRVFQGFPQGQGLGPGLGPGLRRQTAGTGEGRLGPGARQAGGPPGFTNAIHQRIFLLDADKQPVVGVMPPDFDRDSLLPIEVDDSTVGWLGVAAPRGFGLPAEDAFMQHQRSALLIGLGIGLVAAALLAWLLARHLSRPVEVVAGGIRALASGDFKTRLNTGGSDEIAGLADDVNRLSAALGENETTRKRWMSDIAHELRTPLAIISGELEAMNDGVRPFNKEQLDSVRDEVTHLATLVDDLHSLAMTDSGALAYKMKSLELGGLVKLVSDSFRGRAEQKGLKLEFRESPRAFRVQGDEQRLLQLLHNLLENSVCYTDDGGHIEVSLLADGESARISISDTKPGASARECEHLFDRLYRLEASRNRNSGGSGLGLAICRNIVEAHGGQIVAEPGPEGGLLISVRLPLER